MKFPLVLATLLSLACIVSSNGQSTPPPTEAAKPAKLNLVRYKGKTGKPTTNVKVSTRAGDQAAIRIVAIAPGNDAITFKAQPRFWWHQNESTQSGELEFVLTRLGDSDPAVVVRRVVPAMKAGFNVIDLSNRNVNPQAILMEVGIVYQWTINLRSGVTSSPVYTRVVYRENPDTIASNAKLEERLASLGERGNWYELFDLLSSKAEKEIPAGTMVEARKNLLEQIKLSGEIR